MILIISLGMWSILIARLITAFPKLNQSVLISAPSMEPMHNVNTIAREFFVGLAKKASHFHWVVHIAWLAIAIGLWYLL
jgi:hypothetical protein